MKQVQVALDVDGVLYDFQGCARYILNLYRNCQLPPVEEFWFNWDSLQESISEEDWNWLWTEGVTRHGLFRHGHILKGAIEGVWDLHSAGAQLVALTARPASATHDTFDWLAHTKLPWSGAFILADKPKSSIGPACDVYVDDGPHNIVELSRALPESVRLLLFDQPWNRGFDAERWKAQRVTSWSEVLDNVKELATSMAWS